ncbi:hypothetical protein Q604_UNBC10359G0001, partial [human gut metagenome]
ALKIITIPYTEGGGYSKSSHHIERG